MLVQTRSVYARMPDGGEHRQRARLQTSQNKEGPSDPRRRARMRRSERRKSAPLQKGRRRRRRREESLNKGQRFTRPNLMRPEPTLIRIVSDKKAGFFARLFRRSRSREKQQKNQQEEPDQQASSSKTQVTTPTGAAPTTTAVAAVDPHQPSSNSLGTFNAQFPPTEWLYDPRLHLHATTTHGKSRKRDKVALRGVFDPPKIADKKMAGGSRLSAQR